MDRLWIKSLIVLLTLALAGGNAHAEIHLESLGAGAMLGIAIHDDGDEADHHAADHNGSTHDHESGCCCDCLGCLGALAALPATLEAPAEFQTGVWFVNKSDVLADRPPSPDPDPPRTIPLT